jgi:hypothetical protein
MIVTPSLFVDGISLHPIAHEIVRWSTNDGMFQFDGARTMNVDGARTVNAGTAASARGKDGFRACAGRTVQTTVGRADLDRGGALRGGVT